MIFRSFGFSDVGVTVWEIAAVTLAILILALFAASAYVVFRSAPHFQDDVREATMDLSPAMRRRFFELYDALEPRDPAIAWVLAIVLGPLGVHFYRRQGRAFLAALISLNGLGAWWLESWFSAPKFVLIENRALIEQSLSRVRGEFDREARANAEVVA